MSILLKHLLACRSYRYSVDSSLKLTTTIPPRSPLALHAGPSSFASTVGPGDVTNFVFEVVAQTTFGENIFVIGSLAELGGWDESQAVSLDISHNDFVLLRFSYLTHQLAIITLTIYCQIPLSSATYPTWTATVALPANAAFEYKYVRKESDGSVRELDS